MSKSQNDTTPIRPSNFLMLTLSGIINAFGIMFFLSPVSLIDSGFSGTAMFLSTQTKLPLAIFLLLLNTPFFIFGLKKQGKAFTVYSIYAVVVYSAASFVMSLLFPQVAEISPFAGDDLLLCAVFGGLISGIGSGLTIRFGGALDGVEVMAVIFAKRLGVTVGTFVMAYNVVLYALIGIVNGTWVLPLYSIIAYTVALKAVDFIVEGFDKAKAAMIITYHPQEISARLSESFGSGVTLIKASGYYFGEDKTLVYFVVNRFQIGKLKAIVSEVDPKAYVTINDVSDVLHSTFRDDGEKENTADVEQAIVQADEQSDKKAEPV